MAKKPKRGKSKVSKKKGNKGKVLFVEDEKFIAELFRQKFIIEGYTPIIANTAVSSVLALKETKPIAIILDIMLPDSDCWDILKYINDYPNLKKIPTIILTNYGQGENKEKAKKFGVNAFCVKSHTIPSEIVKLVEDLVAGKMKGKEMLIK